MELQALIDGLKAHKSGAASYESVDEAIRVFEAMRDVDGEKVVKGLKCISRQAQDGTCCGCAYFRPFTDDPDCGWCEKMAIENDALSLIRQQQERIAALEAGQHLISVKDRLPEEDVDVLAYNGNYQQIAAYTTNPTKYWYTISGSTISPTHWMSLPEIPKEESQV